MAVIEGIAHGEAPQKHLRRTWTRLVDSAIGSIIDPIAATLLLIEIIVLVAGVFCRYVLHDALTWSDELAAILFLWLTAMGTVSAYRHGAHMKFGALAIALGPHYQRLFSTISTVAVTIFSLMLLKSIIWPTFFMPTGNGMLGDFFSMQFFANSYFAQQWIDLTPALEIPRSLVVLGLVTGFALILVLSVLRLVDDDAVVVGKVVAGAVFLVAIAYVGRGLFASLGHANLILFFVILAGGQIAIGIPIAFAFGLSTFSFLALTTELPLSIVAGQMDDGMTNLVLLAIPLFVVLGLLIESVGIARRLVEAIAAFVGHLRGGLNIVLVAAMFLVSGISGSKLADMAAVTPVLFPEMERRGYRRSEMIALLSTSGAMAELIPPSLILIVIGTVCSLSIQSLFTGGLIPAAVASLGLILVSVFRSRGSSAVAPRAPWSRRLRLLAVASPGLLLPVLIRYFVVAGVTTATEVSTVGVIYSVLVGIFVYREYDWRRTFPMLVETARLTGSIMFIIATATAMGWALTQSGFAADLAAVLAKAPGGVVGFIAISIILFAVLGSVLEGIPAIVLFGPLLFPIAKQLGIHEIHYAIISILALSIGLFAPPFGVGYYGACAVGRCDPELAALAIVPYLLALLGALVVIAAVPWLSIGLL